MTDINNTTIIGRLTADPTLRTTQSGTAVASFTIAVSKSFYNKETQEKKETTSFINCTAWGKQAEVIAEYCKKGHRIGITGALEQSQWTDADGNKKYDLKVIVDNFQFLQPKNASSTESGGNSAPQPPISDGEIPF